MNRVFAKFGQGFPKRFSQTIELINLMIWNVCGSRNYAMRSSSFITHSSFAKLGFFTFTSFCRTWEEWRIEEWSQVHPNMELNVVKLPAASKKENSMKSRRSICGSLFLKTAT